MVVGLLFPGAAAAGTLPYNDPTHGDTVTCSSAAYDCSGAGYNSSSAQTSGWPWSGFGFPYASQNQYGPHNCTLYAAYRLEHNGLSSSLVSLYGHGGQWNAGQWHQWVPSNGNPAVGAIAEWSGGHVAYVESVSAWGITISDDSEGANFTSTQNITWDSTHWPDYFLHIHDLGSQWPGDPRNQIVGYQNTDGSISRWRVDGNGRRHYIGPNTSVYSCLLRNGVRDLGPLPQDVLGVLTDVNGSWAQCPAGDINFDGRVNVIDLSILLSNYGASGIRASDLNYDGVVNILDLSILLSHYGATS